MSIARNRRIDNPSIVQRISRSEIVQSHSDTPSEDPVAGRHRVAARGRKADRRGPRHRQRRRRSARWAPRPTRRRRHPRGRPAHQAGRAPRYILLNKPAGYVTTRSDPQRRRTVIDLLGGVREYVYPVGRLDYDTRRVCCCSPTTATSPRDSRTRGTASSAPTRRGSRACRTRTRSSDSAEAFRSTAVARCRPTSCCSMPAGDDTATACCVLTIREGRNRQVRRMCEAVGHPVRTLKRTRSARSGPPPQAGRVARADSARRSRAIEGRQAAAQSARSTSTAYRRPRRLLTSRPRRAAARPRAASAR